MSEETYKTTSRKSWLLLFAAFLLGAFLVLTVRFVTYKTPNVHYHANFALFVNGQQDTFESFTFYEEVESCSLHDPNNLKTRVHMHNQTPHLVHVHAGAVSWQQFFANLGYTLGDKAVTTDAGTFVDDENDNQLTFMLNGEVVNGVANRIVGDKDMLLINYGKDETATLKSRFDAIPRDAEQANNSKDPSACGSSAETTLSDRLRAALGLQQSH